MPRRSAGCSAPTRLRAVALSAFTALGPALAADAASAQPIPPAPADPEIAAHAAAAAAESAGLPPLPGGSPVPGLAGGGQQGQQQQQAVFVPAGQPPAVQHLSPDRPLLPRDARNLSMATRHRSQACTPSRDVDGTLRFRTGGCEVTVVCAPLRVCNVALEPGEVIMQATDIGDAARWITGVRASQAEGQTTYNIVVKPTDAGLDTTLLFHTNRRTVNLRLVSRRDRYMPMVALEDGIGRTRAEWQQAVAHGQLFAQRQSSPCDAAPVVPPSAFRVGASGWFASDPPWTPVQVYAVATDAGQATCIEFPADVGAMDAPVFVPYDARGQQRTLNVRRLSARRWLVDGAVPRAALVAPDQTKVMIERRR